MLYLKGNTVVLSPRNVEKLHRGPPFNLGRNKLYEGVAGNLVAFVCKISFQKGFDGYVSFTAKTRLIEHYQKTLNAIPFSGQLMIINTPAANILNDKYFKNITQYTFKY